MPKQSDNWSESLCYVAQSDIGMRRSNNQDALVVVLASNVEDWCQRGHTFTVADGMGAHAAGELASKLAVDNLPHTYKKLLQLAPPDALHTAIQEANALIHARGESSPDFHGMGTTCSSLVLLPQGVLIGHVGDSRVYRLRGHRLEQLTFDHSLVWEMEAAQKNSPSAVHLDLPKNVITRSLGPHPEVQIDLEGPFPVAIGDRYLLCSDGLTGPVEDEEVAALLDCLPIDEASQTMIDLANLRGGPDNITVIALEITGPRLAAGSPVAAQVTGSRRGLGLLAGLFAKLSRSSSSTVEPLPGPLGRGPYRRYDAKPSRELVTKLSELADRLDATAREQLSSDDAAKLSDEARQAAASLSSGDLEAALSKYARYIRTTMQAFRQSDV